MAFTPGETIWQHGPSKILLDETDTNDFDFINVLQSQIGSLLTIDPNFLNDDLVSAFNSLKNKVFSQPINYKIFDVTDQGTTKTFLIVLVPLGHNMVEGDFIIVNKLHRLEDPYPNDRILIDAIDEDPANPTDTTRIRITIDTPFVEIPGDGTTPDDVAADRQDFLSRIEVSITHLANSKNLGSSQPSAKILQHGDELLPAGVIVMIVGNDITENGGPGDDIVNCPDGYVECERNVVIADENSIFNDLETPDLQEIFIVDEDTTAPGAPNPTTGSILGDDQHVHAFPHIHNFDSHIHSHKHDYPHIHNFGNHRHSADHTHNMADTTHFHVELGFFSNFHVLTPGSSDFIDDKEPLPFISGIEHRHKVNIITQDSGSASGGVTK